METGVEVLTITYLFVLGSTNCYVDERILFLMEVCELVCYFIAVCGLVENPKQLSNLSISRISDRLEETHIELCR